MLEHGGSINQCDHAICEEPDYDVAVLLRDTPGPGRSGSGKIPCRGRLEQRRMGAVGVDIRFCCLAGTPREGGRQKTSPSRDSGAAASRQAKHTE